MWNKQGITIGLIMIALLLQVAGMQLRLMTAAIIRSDIADLDQRVQLTANAGQFEVGAYWAYQAVLQYVEAKVNPTPNDVILQAKAMHASATADTIQKARKAKMETADVTVIEDVAKPRRWWKFWSRDKITTNEKESDNGTTDK